MYLSNSSGSITANNSPSETLTNLEVISVAPAKSNSVVTLFFMFVNQRFLNFTASEKRVHISLFINFGTFTLMSLTPNIRFIAYSFINEFFNFKNILF